METLVTVLQHMMKLKEPVRLETTPYIWITKRSTNAELGNTRPPNTLPCYGFWTYDYSHRIVLSEQYLGDTDQILATIAHEYVHAWQWETFRKDHRLHHGKRDYFTQWGIYIKQELGLEI